MTRDAVAILGTGLGILDGLAADLQAHGMTVRRSRHPHQGRTFGRIVLGVAYQWRRNWLSNSISRWKLNNALVNVEDSIAQNGIVLVMVQLIGVPPTRIVAVMDRLSAIAENATARAVNFRGHDATINFLAFDETTQRSLIHRRVFNYVRSAGRITTGECVHSCELETCSLQDALNGHVL
ncbi:hypothetical protein [Citricoccus alkalitolerans]|uniref:Uncharacterized protein n=1 Tax=Citricoccus alkalitolerans TaxID=246603 RepID=A0ABV8XWH1_9MICC